MSRRPTRRAPAAIAARGAKRSIAVLVLSAISVAICWLIADQMPTACPAIYPPSAECLANIRQPVAGVVTIIISTLALGVLVAAAFRRFQFDAWPTSMLGVLLGFAVAVGPLVVVLRAGFRVDATLLIIVLTSVGSGVAIVALTRQGESRGLVT
jgi:hypothetical protein